VNALRAFALAVLLTGCSSGRSASTAIAGVAFTDAPSELEHQCQTTATSLGFAIPCPSKLPVGAQPTVFVGGNCPGRSVWVGPGYSAESPYAFASIQWPDPKRTGHVVFVGAPTEMSASAIIYSRLPSSEAGALQSKGHTAVQGVPADLFAVPDDSATAFGSHLVVVWTLNGHTYALGFHGTDDDARQLDNAVTSSLRMVQP
jgi:hypothetical protein